MIRYCTICAWPISDARRLNCSSRTAPASARYRTTASEENCCGRAAARLAGERLGNGSARLFRTQQVAPQRLR